MYHLSDCHVCRYSTSTATTATFNVIKSSKKGLTKLVVKQKKFMSNGNIGKNDFWVLLSSDTTDYVFALHTPNLKEAEELFLKEKEVIKLYQHKRNLKRYKKWLLSLWESPYQVLKSEGYIEWRYGGRDFIKESIQEIFTEKENQRVLNVLLRIDYPNWTEWSIIYSFNTNNVQFNKLIQTYAYDFLKRYTANYEKLAGRRIDINAALYILERLESDEEMRQILTAYMKDKNTWYDQEQRILETYILPLVKRITEIENPPR
jgi:hypothetical protein